ncbi:MAG: class F sortase [Candidatus Nomurabacteria bacterium]|jgi:sortase (surface protein transpeptidase)|nr:class F sortase [Candidatus Nomurabacteria bacterium]
MDDKQQRQITENDLLRKIQEVRLSRAKIDVFQLEQCDQSKARQVNFFANSTKKKSKIARNKTRYKQHLPKSGLWLRFSVTTAFLFIAGFLTFDTWRVNRNLEYTTSALESPKNPTEQVELMEEPEEIIENADQSSATEYAQQIVQADLPAKLKIPRLGVDAIIISQGVDADGTIGIPKSLAQIGWYNGSAKPGESGAMFFSGHFNGDGWAVLNKLHEVSVGDEIEILRDDGTSLKYSVAENKNVPISIIDMSEALSTFGDAREGLTLMTCAGTYNASSGYDARTIVRAIRL